VFSLAGVGAFPTFQLYVNGRKVHEIRGADEGSLRDSIARYKPAHVEAVRLLLISACCCEEWGMILLSVVQFTGSGLKLGSSGGAVDPRAARLAKLSAGA
jgi:hypothetical protein